MNNRFIQGNQASNPPRVPKSQHALKFGILGAAAIAPNALILPARSHPEVVIYAVAARSQAKVAAFAKKWDIPKTYSGSGGYQGVCCALDLLKPLQPPYLSQNFSMILQ